MARSIFGIQEIMDRMEVISEEEENRYSEIPGWDGEIMSWTDAAVLIYRSGEADVWMPISQLRKSGDGGDVYASNWIIEQKVLE